MQLSNCEWPLRVAPEHLGSWVAQRGEHVPVEPLGVAVSEGDVGAVVVDLADDADPRRRTVRGDTIRAVDMPAAAAAADGLLTGGLEDHAPLARALDRCERGPVRGVDAPVRVVVLVNAVADVELGPVLVGAGAKAGGVEVHLVLLGGARAHVHLPVVDVRVQDGDHALPVLRVGERQVLVPVHRVLVEGQRELLGVVQAARLSRLLPGFGEDREEDRRKDRNDRDHDQKLNQRKPTSRDHLITPPKVYLGAFLKMRKTS